jgi:(p)ppGpp synthase/HD superfamily hydrolase
MKKERQPSSFNIDEVEAYARRVHDGQIDDGGDPHIDHLVRVAEGARLKAQDLPYGMVTFQQIIEIYCLGLLHDVLEDTAKDEAERETRRNEIRALGASEDFIADLDMLSRVDPKPVYMIWIRDIADVGTIFALIVKIADNRDNGSEPRISQLPEEKRSIKNRYERAFAILWPALEGRMEDFNRQSKYG